MSAWDSNHLVPFLNGYVGEINSEMRLRRVGQNIGFVETDIDHEVAPGDGTTQGDLMPVMYHVQADYSPLLLYTGSNNLGNRFGDEEGTPHEFDTSISEQQTFHHMYNNTIDSAEQQNSITRNQSQYTFLEPSVPAPIGRVITLIDCSAFDDQFNIIRYKLSTRPRFAGWRERGIDGYIKIDIQYALTSGSDGSLTPSNPISSITQFRPTTHVRVPQMRILSPQETQIPTSPPGLGRGFQLEDQASRKFLSFYQYSFATKRTLMYNDNVFAGSVLQIMHDDPAVMHAALNLAAAYVIDIDPTPILLEKANLHYQQAVRLYKERASDFHAQTPGREEALITLILLLICNDIIYWERRLAKPKVPKWYQVAKIAKSILDASDPGFGYSRPENVQWSETRHSVSNYLAFVNILADAVRPLERPDPTKVYKPYGWLIEGSPSNIKQVVGSTGVSPWLLHTFGMINHLAAKFKQDPENHSILEMGEVLDRRLEGFRQTSPISEDYGSFQALLTDCKRCINPSTKKVEHRGKVVDLISHAWVATARIFLHCRLFRRSRSDPKILNDLEELRECIVLMPLAGELFTAQSPFFPIFILGVVGVGENRDIASNWFETVCRRDRNSVTPVWESLKNLWAWMDQGPMPNNMFFFQESLDAFPQDPGPKEILQRLPWWESLVKWLKTNEGYLSLV